MSLVSARDVSKAYGMKTLFKEISLTIAPGDRVGLVGLNGTGKSTLLKVMAGLESIDSGIVERQRDVRARYLPQEPSFAPERTPREIVREGLAEWIAAKEKYDALGERLAHDHTDALLTEHARLAEQIEALGGWDREHVVEDMLARLSVREFDRPVGQMSGGERRRVALAALLVEEPALAILDEPTNHLDADTIEWLEVHFSTAFKGAVLMVTHDRYVLDAVCTRISELDRGRLYTYEGNYADFLEQKANRLQQEERTESNRLNILRRETEWLRRGPKARTTKQKARIQRAEALVAVQVEKPQEAAQLSVGSMRLGGTILEFNDVAYDIGDRRLFEHLTLHLTAGSRIGIVGPNGVGKTTLLRMVIGDIKPTKGEMKLGANTRIAYFDQSRANLRDDWPIFDNVAEREGAINTGGITVEVGDQLLPLRQYLERFLFDGTAQRQMVGSLSGGERARVALAKILKTKANLLLLDEPTNDLDTVTLGALEEMLEQWPGCALMVSHDRYFLNRLATSILQFEDGKVTHYQGNYETYRELRRQAMEAKKTDKKQTSAATPSIAAPAAATAAPLKALTYAERLELEKMLDVIAAQEEKIAALEGALAEPDIYTRRFAEAKQKQAELDKQRAELDRLVARWEGLELRKLA